MNHLLVCLSALVTLAGEPMFPQGSPPAETLEVVDITSAALDTQLAATTLQGTVNGGDFSRVYLRTRPSDDVWLEHLRKKGRIKGHTEISQDDYFRKYAGSCAKVFVYDPKLPVTINLATMMAALESGMVAAPDDAARFAPGKPVEDLRGRWSSELEAQRWGLRTLWPRMSRKVLAVYHPTATHHFLRDYLVREKVYTFWVGGVETEGRITNAPEDMAFLKDVLAQTPVNIPVIGWWGGGADPGVTEYGGVGLAGEYGKITVGCDWAPNLSVLSGAPADIDGAVAAYRKRFDGRLVPEFNPDKVYIGYAVVESGDSPAYNQDLQPGVWKDPKRGTIPINWGIGAPVLDLIPPVAEYLFEQATPSDCIYLAISGVGYVHPYRDFLSRTPDPGAAWKDYVDRSAGFMRRMGCREMGLYTNAWVPFDRAKQDPVTLRFADGMPGLDTLVMGMGRDENMSEANGNYTLGSSKVLVSHILTRWPVDFGTKSKEENIAWLVDDIRKQTPKTRPAFMQTMALSWAFRPSDIAEVQRRLGDDYVPLALPDFSRYYRAWNEGRK